jgi:hypothetical protein
VTALAFLIAWGNVPFAIAAGVAVVFALLQVSGILGLVAGGGDHDAEVDHDVEADVDHDVDADHEVDAEAEHDAEAGDGHEHEHDGDHGSGHERGLASAALAPLGFGRIPFSMIWQTFCLVFAFCGMLLNARYLGQAYGPPVYTLAWTLPSSVFAGYLGVALVAKVFGPVLSSKGQEATSRAQLVGQIGVVISSKVDEEFGEVRIRDKTGHDIRVVCKLARGSKKPSEHQSVVVVDYDPGRGELRVAPLDEDDDAGDDLEHRDGSARRT